MIKSISLLNSTRITALCMTACVVSVATPALASSFTTGHVRTASAHVAQTYTVELNKTEVIHLPAHASAIIVGNPDIADISIHSSNTIFVIGRSYGETNLTILDTSGQTILNADIQVSNKVPRNGVRVFFGGAERESYNCSPYCAAAPVLGDSPGFIGANSPNPNNIDNNIALGASGQGNSNLSGASGGSISSSGGGPVSSGS